MIATILLPVIAFSIAIVVGRIGTVIAEDMRKDMNLTDKDARHGLNTKTRQNFTA